MPAAQVGTLGQGDAIQAVGRVEAPVGQDPVQLQVGAQRFGVKPQLLGPQLVLVERPVGRLQVGAQLAQLLRVFVHPGASGPPHLDQQVLSRIGAGNSFPLHHDGGVVGETQQVGPFGAQLS
ncbi:hypothetical protein SDC9_195917 [bioreactor metagenome]|uniref:Uncharacterized protein n=1 Tax=bioreactor metagenome TaxID=1076179 RepID=A0A645IB09_9ZZZZ